MPWRIAAITGTLIVVGAVAVGVAIYLPGRPGAPAAGQANVGGAPVADALGATVANGVGLAISALPRVKATGGAKATGRTKATASLAKKPATGARAVTTKPGRSQRKQAVPVYLNPLRALSGLIPERIDMGVDFGGSGPIYALGNAVITNAMADSAGWPGGGWITYQLTSGPAAGLVVYLAEDVTPDVQVGEHVTSSTVIANMFVGGAGIEFGWAMPDSSSAESQLPVAGGISGGGPFPTEIGVNFDQLLQALGVPAAENYGQVPSGLLPSNYPTNWSGVKAKS